jgi:hypothetical protein
MYSGVTMEHNGQAGILAIWNDCRAGAEADYEAWYRGEHLRERVALPGFRFARRYVSASPLPRQTRYFTFYETDTADVLSSPVYLERGINPTPTTRHIMTDVFLNMTRTVCRREAVSGEIRGTAALTMAITSGAPEAIQALWAEVRVTASKLRAELWLSAEPAAAAPSNEERLRGRDAKITACIIVEFQGEDELATYAAEMPPAADLVYTLGAFRLLCSLDRRDIG